MDKKIKIYLWLNYLLIFALVATLVLNLLNLTFFRNQNILAGLAIFATAIVLISALKSLKQKRISVDLLASIALIVSLIEREWISAIFINLMIACARAFIDYVKIRSHSAINSLLKIKPKKVKIFDNGKVKEISIEHLKAGDRVVVELGERIPADGIIESGEASIDQSSLTGESIPVFKKAGDRVLSSGTVVSGNLTVLAEKVGQDTTFEKIIALVEQSQFNKAPIYTLIDKFANWYIAATIVGSAAVYFLTGDIKIVLALLLVSCADDISIATPIALMSAITHSARHGAVIKGGDYLEALAKLKVVVFDKTGTLTRGKLKVENIVSFSGISQNEVIKTAATVAQFSLHPVAETLSHYAEREKIEVEEPESFEEFGGRGMSAILKGKKIIIGNLRFLQESKIIVSRQIIEKVEAETQKGLNITLVAVDADLIGYIALADELRPNIKQTIEELRKAGVSKIVMLTGDNEAVAQKVAQDLGIDEFHANLLPDAKLKYLKKYLNKKYKVAMVGDGVNDAPTLALSDVGIAMGTIGSDAAIEAADVAMMKDDLSQIPQIMKIGKSALKVIRQNLVMWAILNVLGFGLVFSRILDPSGAAIWNFATDFIPIINSLRMFR